MRVFVTGATGFVGSAVVKELMSAGHRVIGLARSDAGAAALSAVGANVHRGSLDDLESLRRGAAAAEGVIHTAFNHDFSQFKANCESDRRVIEALGAALVGTNRALIITSGTGLLSLGRPSTEDDAAPAGANVIPRVASEEAATAVAARGVRVSVVRLPPSVHGDGDHGFVPMLIAIAREKGVSAYIGDGLNRWPAAHRLDAASLYRLALEQGHAGERFHGAAEEGVPFKDIAAVIARRLRLPVAAQTPEAAAVHFGWLAHFAGMDSPASSAKTRQRLGWQVRHPGLLADLDREAYFSNG
jgi:nucleoside-diphosphate-sugar epimerase